MDINIVSKKCIDNNSLIALIYASEIIENHRYRLSSEALNETQSNRRRCFVIRA